MSSTALTRLEAKRNKKKEGAGAVQTASAQTTKSTDTNKKNNGSALAYLGEKLAVGTVRSFEGITDFLVGGVADIVGADDFAKKLYANDWFGNWYSHPDEWYNPGEGMKFAGAVLEGIGTSAPAIAASVVATLATGGAALPAIAAGFAGGLSAGGGAISEAYKETGELNSKTYGYALQTGVTEGVLEGITGGFGTGAAKLGKTLATKLGKEATEKVAKSGAKKVILELGKEFASEGFEEGMSAILDPVYRRSTIDPNAQNATVSEILYDATVGGFSGMLMGGASGFITSGKKLSLGNKIVNNGEANGVIEAAEKIADYENKNNSEDETFTAIRDTLTDLKKSLEGTNGEFKTAKQKRMLAELQINTSFAVFSPVIKNSALRTVHNADAVAERFNAYGFTDANGNPITITAEQIREGVDLSSQKSIRKALKNNNVLRTIAVMDATGQLVMNQGAFAEATLEGKNYATQDDLNTFAKEADPETFKKVSEALNITDEEWRVMTPDLFTEKMSVYESTDEGKANVERAKLVKEAKSIPETEAKEKLPTSPRTQKNGSIKRYKTANADIAIIKDNGKYTIFNYQSRKATRALSLAETVSEFEKLKGENLNETKSSDNVSDEKISKTESKNEKTNETTLSREYREAESFAEKNIPDYKKLYDPAKRAIQRTIVEARANGLADADIATFAKFSAKSGINVAFDKKNLISGIDENGNYTYADGLFDGDNTIYINKDSKRRYSSVIFHELMHSLVKNTATKSELRLGKSLLRTATKRMDSERRSKIEKAYKKYYKSLGSDLSSVELADEILAHYTEDVMGDIDVLEFLEGEVPGLGKRIIGFFNESARTHSGDENLSREARKYARKFRELYRQIEERHKGMNASEVRMSGKISDSRFSLQFADKIAENQREYIDKNSSAISLEELNKAIEQTAEMVDIMSAYKHILPEDKLGKRNGTLVKNGSYDVSVENTTICIRTLAYNAFVDMVSEKIGRPLTQMESFLVSQKLYDIAKEPQCLYCYVSLDRKAFNDMVLRYVEQRDAAIKAYEEVGKPKITRSSQLYIDFLNKRKDTDNAWNRYKSWIDTYNKGEAFVSLEEVATEASRAELFRSETSKSEQIKDILKYAQSASWAKKQTQYIAYYDDILRMNGRVVRDLNKHYGLRWYSFSDYSGAFIVENMQQITDASIRGLKGLAYTKDTDFVKIFAPTGMNINISVYATKDANGNYVIDEKQSANIEEAIKLREKYSNVGIVVVATDTQGVEWALAQEWSDVVIPFHTVRTGAQVAEFYNWTVFNEEQSDTVGDQNLWDKYVESLAPGKNKKVSKMIYPSEHQNDRATYLKLIKERGLKPRFSSFLDNPNYMKLVNETRQSEAQTEVLKPIFSLKSAKASFQKFVEKGGYYEGWYNDGIDVDAEAEIVAKDVKAGKKANEVSYGRQDINVEDLQKSRKSNRAHARAALDIDSEPNIDYNYNKDQYERFGWARNAKAISKNELDDLYSKIKVKSTLRSFKQSSKGESIIEVNDNPHTTLGTNNVFVFVKGTKNNFTISRVIRFDAETEMEMEIYKERVYERRAFSDTHLAYLEQQGFATQYARESAESFNKYKELRQSGKASRGTDTDNQGRKKYGSGYSLVIGEDGEVIEKGGKRFALDIDTETDAEELPNTLDSVAKERETYSPGFWKKLFSKKDRLYIETVDENFGVQKYIEKVGKRKDAAAIVNMARSSRAQAQTMIGSVQYDLFSGNYEELGEGISKILEPITKVNKAKGETREARALRVKKFNDYMLHQMNIDRMTLEERSLQWHQADVDALAELNEKLMKAEKAYTEAKAELDKLKGVETNEALLERKKLRDRMSKEKGYMKHLKTQIKPLKAKVDSFVPLKNKPVFGENATRAKAVTAEQSRKIIEKYEKENLEFKAIAEKVYGYLRNNQKMRVEAGLISQEDADYMEKLYPHYVPTYRDTSYSGAAAVTGAGNIAVSSTVKRSKGGGQNILELQNSIAEQTNQLIKAANINRIATAIYEAAVESGDTEYVEIISKEKVDKQGAADSQMEATEIIQKNNQVTFFYKGEKITMSVTKDIFIGFEGLYKPTVEYDSVVLGTLSKLNKTYKAMVTSYSPAFLVRNPIRDIQDAGLNSKHARLFIKNLRLAWKDIFNNSDDWKLYRAMGGFSSTVFTLEGLQNRVGERGFTEIASLFDSETDQKNVKKIWSGASSAFKAAFQTIENLNAVIEQATRFAEFKASLEAGDNAQIALYNSAEVTTNFGRRGRITKTLNATIMPFLNPAIQGFDKMFRNVTDAFKKGEWDLIAKAFAKLLVKAFIVGMAPQILNALMYSNDEDYEDLRETDKENNFLIKVGNQFVKIPRGRVASVIGGALNRLIRMTQGKDADIKGYLENVVSQVTPAENISRTIFSPWNDIRTNTTWYGTDIEGKEFDAVAPRDRYDESTSKIAVTIGQAINYSPKKIHYLLDQYSGVIGDIALPATTPKAGNPLLSYKSNFLLDPATSNKISSKFYELFDEVQYAKSAYDTASENGTAKDGDEAVVYQLKYLNRVKKSVSELYDQKRAIQSNTELSAVDKLQQARTVQMLINAAQKNAMADFSEIKRAIEVTSNLSEDVRFTEATRIVYGAESALEAYDNKVYQNAQIFNAAGLDFENYYYYYFSTRDIESDKDKNGNTIAGSKRKKVIAAINEMGLNNEQTLLLIASSGYSIKDGDIRGMSANAANRLLAKYITSQKITTAQKKELAEKCGYTVRNGKIIINNK